MPVTPVAAENTQQHGAHDIEGTATAIAGVLQRAVPHELLPTATRLEELKEEVELAVTSDRRVLVPFRVKPPAGRVQRPCSSYR